MQCLNSVSISFNYLDLLLIGYCTGHWFAAPWDIAAGDIGDGIVVGSSWLANDEFKADATAIQVNDRAILQRPASGDCRRVAID